MKGGPAHKAPAEEQELRQLSRVYFSLPGQHSCNDAICPEFRCRHNVLAHDLHGCQRENESRYQNVQMSMPPVAGSLPCIMWLEASGGKEE